MADYNSSLPIRTENAGDAIVKVADATIPSQQLAVEANGSINVNADLVSGAQVQITDGTDTLAVNADGSINAVVSATDLDIRDLNSATDSVTVLATDLDIRDLSAAQDNVAISDGTDTLAVNADGSINAVVMATDLDIRDLNSATDSVTVLATDLDIRDLSAAQDNVAISDGTDTLAVNADGSLNAVVSATDLDIRDLTHASDSVRIGDGTDFLAVNTDGSINVRISDRSGVEVLDYNTASAVAAGATSNHDYTTTGAFRLTQVEAAASGKARIEVQIETGAATNVFNTQAVQFNSTATPNMTLQLSSPPLVTSGARVRIIRRNADNQAQDLYSTVIGYNE